ncbi:MAG: TcfC E-set like domain-containing protein [Lactobacillales bacterium]|nr:TcfC E-set like domain-containing protein [Lactobacillales bacterium]
MHYPKIVFGIFLLCIWIQGAHAFAAPQKVFLKTTEAPPPGFEKIEEQEININVYYQKDFVAQVKVIANGNKIRLLDPAPIIKNLPPIKPEKENAVIKELQKTHPFNSRYSCYPEKKQECGMMLTPLVAYAYNPATLTMEIFANNDIFIKPGRKINYLKPQDDAFSQYFKFNAAGYWSDRKNPGLDGGYIAAPMSYSANSDDLYNVTVNSKTLFLGYTLNADLNYINERQNPFLDNIALIKYYEKSDLKIGEFNTQDFRTLNQANVLGVSLISSVNRRKNDPVTFSSPISIYLNYRSTINLIKDGRIYSSRAYEAGSQELDTQSLPFGSYNLEIEIIEPNGNIRRERRFFVKNGELPPPDEFNYWLEFGAVQKHNGNYNFYYDESKMFNTYENDYLIRGGIYKGISKSTALGSNLVLNKDISAAEVFAEYFGARILFKSGVGADTDGNYGYNVYAQYGDNKRVMFYASWTQNFLKDIRQTQKEAYQPIASYAKSGDMNLKYYFRDGLDSIGIRGSYYKNITDEETYLIGPELELNFNDIKNTNMRVTLSAYRTNRDYQGMLTLSLNFNSKHVQIYNNSNYHISKDRSTNDKKTQDGFDSSTAVTLQDGGIWDEDARLTFRYDDVNDIETKGAELDFRNNYGRLLASSSMNSHINQYSVNFTSTFAFDKENILFGGKEQNDSAIAVEVSGADKESIFDIYANQYKVDSVTGESMTIVTLNSFDEYSIALYPQNTSQGYVESTTKSTIALYPGSMNTVKYRAKSTAILVGTLYDTSGNILKNARIKGEVDETRTDADGTFQMLVVLGEELAIVDWGKTHVPEKIPSKDKVIFIDRMVLE